jgi:hypothetical protein
VTTNNVQEKETCAALREYLKRRLAQGGALSKLLLQEGALDDGVICVLTPGPLDSQTITELDRGHFVTAIPGPITDSVSDLVKLINQHLKGPEDVCLMENSIARAGDSHTKRMKSRVVTYGMDVYHVVFGSERERMPESIREARNIPIFVGAVGSLSGESVINGTISKEVFLTVAKDVKCVFAGAYDGEGFVVLERNKHK